MQSKHFVEINEYLPGISALGILLIVFFSVAKVAPQVVQHPLVFLLVAGGLFFYYIAQTVLAVVAAKMFRFDYAQGMILILAATASSQAIALALAATMFSSLTVFALSFKPVLQVLYIMFLIYMLGPRVRVFLRSGTFPWSVFIISVFVVSSHHQKVRPKTKNNHIGACN